MNKEVGSYLIIVIVALIITIVIMNFFSFYLVSGDSMAPTLEDRNYLVVEKKILSKNQYKRGDIIVFNVPIQNSLQNEKDIVKRIIATQGDKVKIENNNVYVNNEIISENYLLKNETIGNLEMVVEPKSYFVLGDNRKVSLDSRESSIGLIKEKEIIGKVIIKMFPFDRIGDEIYEY